MRQTICDLERARGYVGAVPHLDVPFRAVRKGDFMRVPRPRASIAIHSPRNQRLRNRFLESQRQRISVFSLRPTLATTIISPELLLFPRAS